MNVDVHQHLWTAPLVEALERRRRLPFVRREGPLYTVHLAGETPSVIELDTRSLARRQALLRHDGVDCALIALSSPLGIEALPRAEALELIEAHLDGVQGFGEGFAAWGPLALDGARAEDVDELLDRGCVGVSLPAGALSPPEALDRLHSVLARVEQRAAPLFIHPGLGLGARPAEPSLRDPLWWPALTAYVAQMQAAWLSLATLAPRIYPRLRIVFAMLAGGAPLLSERLTARGGPATGVHSQLFYDTSSYGPVAVEAMAELVGGDQLVFGSDRPVVEPTPTGRDAALRRNGAWLAPLAGVGTA